MTPINDRPSENVVDLDEVFKALSHAPRRRILVALMKDNPRRRQEFETVEFGQDDDEIETITLQLHHSHLPQLDDADFIDWNQRTEMVIKGEKFEEIRPLLELMDTHEDELPGDWP